MSPQRFVTYTGPACPRCGVPIALDRITPGEDICTVCRGFFTAAVFRPPSHVTRVVQLGAEGPENASACANHPRNAAVTSCERCGLFICSLCELDLFGGKYCPACFDRMTQEGGEIQKSIRNWRGLALGISLAGLLLSSLMIGIPLGFLTIYYVIRGFRDPERSRDQYAGLIIAFFLAIGDIAIGIAMFSEFFLK